MQQAVANYAAYLHGPYNWMLGRFIVPVARLEELQEALVRLENAQLGSAREQNESRWRLSALPGPEAGEDILKILEFNGRFEGRRPVARAVVESVELKLAGPKPSAHDVERLSRLFPVEMETYFEIPMTDEASQLIEAVARCGRRGKIRTGGETAEKFPAPESLVEFIRMCAHANAPFKATAGLHHPLRSVHRLTYQPDSPSGVMHGFLNVFLAAAFLRAGMQPQIAVALLKEDSPQAFHFDSNAVTWREHRLNLSEIVAAREQFAISFGSCSFTEPVDDLRSLHLL